MNRVVTGIALILAVFLTPILSFSQTGARDKEPVVDKTGLTESLKACYRGCTERSKDAEAYEGCMIKCKKADRARYSPVERRK